MSPDPRIFTLPSLFTEVSAFAARDIDRSWMLAMGRLGELLEAKATFITVATRDRHDPSDVLLGWRPRALISAPSAKDPRFAVAWSNVDQNVLGDLGVQRQVCSWGTHRAARISDLFTPEEAAASPSHALLVHYGVHDRLVGAHALSPQVEVYLGCDRYSPPTFSEADRDLLAAAMAGLGRACRWLMLSLGAMPGQAPLSERERECLLHLLGPAAEREIASAMGVSAPYVRELVTSVFRKMRVASRAELVALWLD
jgi:DNA-binding CsgD family transcriptional regulator